MQSVAGRRDTAKAAIPRGGVGEMEWAPLGWLVGVWAGVLGPPGLLEHWVRKGADGELESGP